MNENEQKQADPKLPYSSPSLVEYGNVRSLTNSVGNMGMSDGGVSPMHKTGT